MPHSPFPAWPWGAALLGGFHSASTAFGEFLVLLQELPRLLLETRGFDCRMADFLCFTASGPAGASLAALGCLRNSYGEVTSMHVCSVR